VKNSDSQCDIKEHFFLIDAEDQQSSMKLGDNADLKSHLTELKQHFQLMIQCQDNLLKMGSMLVLTYSYVILTRFISPNLQTIMAAE